jgi:hypothetical protein
MFGWLIPTVAIQIYRDRMRVMLCKQIRRLRRERHAMLLGRREVRNAARLPRENGGVTMLDEGLDVYDRSRAADMEDRPIYSTVTIAAAHHDKEA